MKIPSRLFQLLATWPFFLIGVMPVLLLLFRSLVDWLAQENGRAFPFDLQRETLLLAKTIAYSGTVAMTVTAVGVLAAVFTCGSGKKIFQRYAWLLFMTLPVPACVHSLAWLRWNGVLNNTGWLVVSSRGWLMAWFVQSLALLPVAVLIIAGGVLAINKEQIFAAQLLGNDTRFLVSLLPRYLKPQILATLAIVFMLTINDYAIPSVFSVNVYALDIFVEYSSSLSVLRTILKSLPLTLIQAAVLLAILGLISEVFLSGRKQDANDVALTFPKSVQVISSLALILVLVQMLGLVSVILLDRNMWQELGSTLISTSADLATSLSISAITLILGIPVIYTTASWLNQTRFRKAGLFLVILPTVLPASLIGAAYINLFNHPATNWIYNSALMPGLAVLARFMPFGVLVTLAWIKRMDQNLVNAALLVEGREWRNALRIKLPMISAGLLIGSALIVLFGIGELGATILVLPPGMSTVTVRLYNYLHYGATEMVLGLSFMILAVIVILAGLAKILTRGRFND